MKNIYIYIISACICILVASCTSTTTVTVQTTPGTEILTPRKTRLAVADSNGHATFSIDDDNYYSLLLSKNPTSDEYIPFALDYKHKVRGSKFVSGLGGTLFWGGLFVELVGVSMVAADPDLGLPVVLGGAASALISMPFYLGSMFKAQQTAYKHEYQYLENQKANDDLPIASPKFEKFIISDPVIQHGTISTSSSSSSGKTLGSSSSKKTLKDAALSVEGDYVGTGSLLQDKTNVESYNGISVTIKKSSKDVVKVNVIEANGDKFFDTDEEYSVKKLSDGKYELTNKNVKTAKITISGSSIVYTHPRVNIEGDIYTLSINGNK